MRTAVVILVTFLFGLVAQAAPPVILKSIMESNSFVMAPPNFWPTQVLSRPFSNAVNAVVNPNSVTNVGQFVKAGTNVLFTTNGALVTVNGLTDTNVVNALIATNITADLWGTNVAAGGMTNRGGTGRIQIGVDGDLDVIKDVSYSWPTVQGSTNSILDHGLLMNVGSGNLIWGTNSAMFYGRQITSVPYTVMPWTNRAGFWSEAQNQIHNYYFYDSGSNVVRSMLTARIGGAPNHALYVGDATVPTAGFAGWEAVSLQVVDSLSENSDPRITMVFGDSYGYRFHETNIAIYANAGGGLELRILEFDPINGAKPYDVNFGPQLNGGLYIRSTNTSFTNIITGTVLLQLYRTDGITFRGLGITNELGDIHMGSPDLSDFRAMRGFGAAGWLNMIGWDRSGEDVYLGDTNGLGGILAQNILVAENRFRLDSGTLEAGRILMSLAANGEATWERPIFADLWVTNRLNVGSGTNINHTNKFTVSTPGLTNTFNVHTNGDVIVNGLLYANSVIFAKGGLSIGPAAQATIGTDGNAQFAVVDGTGLFTSGVGFRGATNTIASWPTGPATPGAFAIVNSNGFPYMLLSTNGAGSGSATWTGTNRLGW